MSFFDDLLASILENGLLDDVLSLFQDDSSPSIPRADAAREYLRRRQGARQPYHRSTNTELQRTTSKPVDRNRQSSWRDVCFVHCIPGEDNDDGVIVLADGSLRKVIACRGINALLLDSRERNRLAQDFSNLADSIEYDIQIIVTSRHLPVDEYLSRYQSQINTEEPFLRWYAEYTNKWFRRVQEVSYIPQRDFYVVVSFVPADAVNNFQQQWNGKRSPQRHQEFVDQLERQAQIVFEQLRAARLQPEFLKRPQLRNLLYRHLNPRLSVQEPDAPASSLSMSEPSTLCRSGLKVRDEYLWLDGKYIGSQYMQRLPHETWFGWFVDLLTTNLEYTASIFVHCCNQDQVRQKLEQHYRVGLMSNTQLAMAPDIEAAETTNSAMVAIQNFLRSSQKAFDMSFSIKTQANTVIELESAMDELRRIFKNHGALLDRAQGLQLDTWQSCLPVGVDRLAYVHRVMTPVIGTMWPFFTASCGTPQGVPLGFAIASREPVLLDPFYRGAGKNANNMFVVGTTGAGKSFAMLMLMLRLLPLGMQFVLIDKTVDKFGAYRFMTELLGEQLATYIDLGPACGQVINPFDLAESDGTPEHPSADKVTKLLALLDLMLAPEGQEELSVEEKSILDGLIRSAYRRAAVQRTLPTMSLLAVVAHEAAMQETDPVQRDRLKQFARGLGLFTRKGTYGGLVDGLTNIDSNKVVIVFDTREVNDPRLERITAYILAEFIRQRAAAAKSQNLRLAAIIDEAATLMRFKSGARLLDDLSRRARHYGMMLITITQQIKDFFRQSELADSVVKNADMKILLRQDPSDLTLLKEILRLSDAEQQAIADFANEQESRKDSQCLLVVGSSRGTIRIVPSNMDLWICTSEPIHDIPKRRRMMELIKEKNPHWSSTNVAREAVYRLSQEA